MNTWLDSIGSLDNDERPKLMWPFKKSADPFDQAMKLHLDGDFSVFAAGNDAPSERIVEEFEHIIGFRLPQDFRSYSCSKLGGLYVEAKDTAWPRAKAYDVAPFWSFLYGLFVYGFSAKIPESMNIRLQTEQFRTESKTLYVPCLKILMDANVYCFDEQGMVRRWDHETGEAPLQNKTFSEVFVHELAELRKRKDRKLAESEKV